MAGRSFTAKTVMWGAGAGVLGLAAGPVTAGIACAATIFARTNAMSLASAFNGKLDNVLRAAGASGHLLKRVQRFSKPVDRLACGCSHAAGTSVPVALGPMHQPSTNASSRDRALAIRQDSDDIEPITTKQDKSLIMHSGIVVEFESSDGSLYWIKIEFAKEGLDFSRQSSTPAMDKSYLIESCPLLHVSPITLANCLQNSRHRTYNALTWNCNHVADMIWEALLKSSTQRVGATGAATTTNTSANVNPVAGASISRAAPIPVEERRDVDNDFCKVCYEHKRSTLFLPCGHYDTCSECADKLAGGPCPFCNELIHGTQRVYS